MADATLIGLVVPDEGDIAGGAEPPHEGPVRQAKHGALLIACPGRVRVVNGLVLH